MLRAFADSSQAWPHCKGCSDATPLTLAGKAPRPTEGEVQATTELRRSEPDGQAAGRRRTDSPACLERPMDGANFAMDLFLVTLMHRKNGAFICSATS